MIVNKLMLLIWFLILIVVAVDFYKTLKSNLHIKNALLNILVSILITIAIPVIMYFVQKKTLMRICLTYTYIWLSFVVYIILILVIKSYTSYQNGFFFRSDKIYMLIYILCSIILIVKITEYGKFNMRGLFFIIILILTMAFIFYKISIRLYKQNYYEKEAEELKDKVSSGEDYLKNVQIMDKQIRMIRHDMKNQLLVLNDLVKSCKYDELEEYLQQYGLDIEKTKEYIHTDNLIFNTLVNNKIDYAKSENIIVSVGMHKVVKSMQGNDLYTVIGNILDNAIEAELKENINEREIDICSFWDGDDYVFRISNYISESVLNNNINLSTSKNDKKMHGLGTQIIKKLVKKNKGKCDYYEDDNQFYCEIRW